VARWTRLELATPCVTGRYSNQLNYHRAYIYKLYFALVVLKILAKRTKVRELKAFVQIIKMVGITRLELVTSTL
jgi:hypothetical protein